MAGQTTYNNRMDVAFSGLIYDMRNITVESYACETSTGVPFGSAVVPGTDPRKQVKAPSGSGQGFRGIALHEYSHEQDPSTGQARYNQYETVNVLRKGAVWVQTNGTVVEGASAFYVASGADAGLFGGSGEATGGKYRSGCTGSGLAIVEIDL